MATATAAAQRAPSPQPASKLGLIKKGRLRTPLRYFFHGNSGTGKTTLAASAPKPVFADIEGGSGTLDLDRYMFRDEVGGHVPRSYGDVLAAVEDLTVNPHDFQTLVLDTADELEKLLWKHICERESQPSARNKEGELTSIEHFGYGRGYTMAVDEWRTLAARLDRLRLQRGMAIVINSHSIVRTFKSPTGPDYDRFSPALNDKASGFLRGWCDVVGFLVHEETSGKAPGEGRFARNKGFSTGRHLIKLSHNAAWDAKSRLTLPDEIEMDVSDPWGPFAAAVEQGYDDQLPNLKKAIGVETARIGNDALTAKVNAAVAAAEKKGDAATLHRYLTDLQGRPTAAAEEVSS